MSQHVVTLRNAILEARAALIGATALTDLVPERSITFGNSPQKDRMPRIVIEVSGAEYDATFTQSRKVQTFTVEYAVYSKSVDTCTAIMDEVRDALDTYQSSAFAVRVTDESFQAEVDNVLLGVVVATFQDAAGIPGFDTSAAATLAAVQDDLDEVQAELAAETAAWEAATGLTLAEYQALPTPSIAYNTEVHKPENNAVVSSSSYPNGYQAAYESGALNPVKTGPISYLAQLDTSASLLNDTLVENNAFGNKHRFTYDDGTQAIEISSNNPSTVQSVLPAADGYTGQNPQYIIDNLTGLGWHRSYLNDSSVAAGEWWNGRSPEQDFPNANSESDMYEEVANLSLHGYSDWRVASLQEVLQGYGGPTDNSNVVSSTANQTTDAHFPPLNAIGRGSGVYYLTLGPINDNGNVGWPRFITNSNVANIMVSTTNFFSGTGTGTNGGNAALPLVRRHFI